MGRSSRPIFFFKIRWRGRVFIFHIEFQKARDTEIARRMWIYNTLMDIQNDLYVYSVLMYLTKESGLVGSPYVRQIPEIPSEEELGHKGFGFQVFKIFEDLDPELLLTTEFHNLLPLLILTRGGQNRETVDRMITEIQARGLDHLLFLGFRFATLVLTDPEDRRWLKERYHMLKNAVCEDYIYQEAVDEGRQQAAAEVAQAREEAAAARQQAREEAAAEIASLREEAARVQLQKREEVARVQEEMNRVRGEMLQAREEMIQAREKAAQAHQQTLQVIQQAAINIVIARFPELAELARALIAAVSDLERLQKLILEMSFAPNQEHAQQLLFSLVLNKPLTAPVQGEAINE